MKMKMYSLKKLKSVIGIFLILLSIAGLFFWELKGRDAVMMDEVLVAKEEIKKGTNVDSTMFIARGVPKENLLKNAVGPEKLAILEGKVASQLIAKNGQIILDYFQENEFRLGPDESVFVIDPSWIAMRSSALRRGDLVEIYGANGVGLLGTFQVAFVKDVSEREVVDAGEQSAQKYGNGILERTDSTSVIDHIEIITTYREYEKLKSHASGSGGTTPSALIIVQRGDKIDT